MSSGIYVATAGAVAQSNALDAAANNIANASTAGFHGDVISFKEVLGKAKSPDAAMVSQGSTHLDSQAGAITQTGNPLDLALDGDGYFQVQNPQGQRYTRAGNFQLDDKGQLAAADGSTVMSETNQPILVPPGANLGISPDGTVTADGNTLGKLKLVRFNASQMKREGGTLMSATGKPLAGDPPKVRAGMLESSNVNIVRGVTDMVKIQRNYEALMKFIQSYHDLETRAAQTLGAPK